MRVAVRIIVGLAILAGLVFGLGLALPRQHRATSRVTLAQPIDQVWAVVRDPASLVGTWSDLKSSRRVRDGSGRELWEQKAGGFDMRLIVESASPPRRLVTRVDGETDADFGGTWTYTLSPVASGGTTVAITEDGFVNNPLFRVMMKLMGTHRTIDGYLKALGDKFDEMVKPEHVR